MALIPFPGWMHSDSEDADALGGVLYHGQDAGLGAVEQVGGSIPAFFRISQTAGAATFTPRPASSPWIRRYPHPGFSRASRRTRALMFRQVAGRRSCRAWT